MNKKDLSFKIFLLAVNLYLVMILFDINQLKTPAIALGSTAISIYVGDRLTGKNENKKFERRFKGTIMDKLGLNKKYFIINKKYLVISILGLIIPILIISQSVLLTANFNQQAIDGYLAENDQRALTINFNVDSENEFISLSNSLNNALTQIVEENKLELDKIESNSFIDLQIQSGKEKNESGFRFLPTIYTTGIQWEPSILEFLNQFPTFNLTIDAELDSTLLILPPFTQNVTDIVQNGEVQLVFGEPYAEPNDNSTFTTFTHDVENVWMLADADLEYILLNNIEIQDFSLFGVMIMPKPDLWITYNQIVDEFNKNTANPGFFSPLARINTELTIKFPNDGSSDLKSIKRSLIAIQSEVNAWMSKQSQFTKYGFFILSPLSQVISVFEQNRDNTDSILFLISVPLAGLAVVFVMFMMKLVEERRKKIIASMKVRGTSSEQLQFNFFTELLIVSTISISLGMIISIPLTLFSIQQSSLLNVNLDTLIIPPSWYWKTIVMGIILSLDVNAISYHGMINASFDDIEDLSEQSVPLWQRYSLDIIFFVVGMGFWLFLQFQDPSSTRGNINNLRPFALLLVIFTAPLFLARFFPIVITNTLSRFFAVRGGILKVATNNLTKHKFSTSQLAGFLLFGIMLTSVSFIVPQTYVEYGIEKTKYDIGADIYIDGLDSSNFTVWNSVGNVTGVEAYTEIAKITGSPSFFGRGPDDPTGGGGFSFLGVQPDNFSDAAFWRNNYDSQSLTNIIAKIETNTSVAIQKDSLKQLKLDIGDKYTYFYGFDNKGPISVVLDITAEFNLFPNLVKGSSSIGDPPPYGGDNYGYYEPEISQSVPSIAYIDLVKLMGRQTGYQVGSYVKVKDGFNITGVAQDLKKLLSSNSSISITSFEDKKSEFLDSVETKVIATLLQGMQQITILLVALAIAYYSIINLSERRKEIGIFRSLGMTRRQITTIFIFEILSIVTYSLATGFIFGQFISQNFFSIATSTSGATIIPPTTVSVPWDILQLLSIFVLGYSVLVAIISGFNVTSKETGNILRED